MKKPVLYVRILTKPVRTASIVLVFSVISFVIAALVPAVDRPAAPKKKPADWKLENAFPNLTFQRPVEFTYPNDGSNPIFVLEQEGKIRVFDNKSDVKTAPVFLDVTKKVSDEGEMGLLGLAFHPDFRKNGYLYIYYTKRKPLETVIARYQASGSGLNVVNPSTETVILRFDQPYDNHNGGKIAFGPDGYLYIATGDGGAWGDQHNNAQNLSAWLGKILRIDINKTTKGTYGIPADNPFAGNKEGHREEIYAYGLRNPWRFSFDRKTGQMWAGDVGQNEFEEIDIITKGGNYGWRLKEATRCYNPRNDCETGKLIDPIHHYVRSEGTSITGGVVYRGTRNTLLQGKYLYADYASGKVWVLTFENDKKTDNQLLVSNAGTISAFGEDAAGEAYLLDHQGTIKRLSLAK
ncbi:PQQ-dependent sugar dehydrogenase [Spirosoma sp. BT702]|uniref:PQQ-dependent sugar dehydrogenase n=1 Tax=Spirosoma profusum TaxID=2771354 RepID=A0A927ATJ4_9BACT|nr:PQQ-dependent sugar dehydrogenase [Spirosoma profusum]MBD2700377.1 PQQ-dependent sugar dehydrogenase [Spirosoma profusum]